MRRFLPLAAMLAVAGFIGVAGFAQDRPLPSPGDVELTLRRPDGTPAAGAQVVIVAESSTPGTSTKPQASTTTDSKGTAKFSWPSGTSRMKASLPGIGYGTTGVVEVLPGKVAKIVLPPLAPYAHITGTLPESLRKPDTVIHAGAAYINETLTTQPAADGRYSFDVRAGDWSLWVTRGADSVARTSAPMPLTPGKSVRDPKFEELPKPEGPQSFTAAPRPGAGQTITWVEGTVKDTAGKPVAGATVYVMATYYGGIRMYENISKATSDATGHYAIEGQGGLRMFSASVLALTPNHPPAWAWLNPDPIDDVYIAVGTTTAPAKLPPTPILDLVIPETGGKLDVSVMRDGNPVANAGVAVWREGANLRDQWAAGGGPEHQAIEHAAYPYAVTDAAGIAHFADLLPGTYQILAGPANESDLRSIHDDTIRGAGDRAVGSQDGIPVRAGELKTTQLAIFLQPNTVDLHIIDHTGKPLSGSSFPYNWERISGGSSWSSSRGTTADGLARVDFASIGIWKANFQYKDAPITTIPTNPPYFMAEGFLAVSPSLTAEPMPVWNASRHELGSVHVTVLDAAGKPVRCVVDAAPSAGEAFMTGSTDEKGQIFFEHLPKLNQPCIIRLADPGVSLNPNNNIGDLPAELPTSFTAPIALDLPLNANEHITLRPQPVCWIRGKVHPREGQALANMSVYIDADDSYRGASVQFDQRTGNYVAGPYTGKNTHLSVSFRTAQGESRRTVAVPLNMGKVVPKDLDGPNAPAKGGNEVLIGAGGISSKNTGQSMNGTVFLADGKTPAFGADVSVYEPNRATPTYGGIADALGQIRSRPLTVYGNPSSDPPGSPETPVVVARLPGANGAVVVPLPEQGTPLRLVLPPAHKVRGKVTIGRAAPVTRPAHIRVAAIYQPAPGNEKTAHAFNVLTTADVTGQFELAGLSPGTYKVQAALDDIWLSDSQTLAVTEKSAESLPALLLEIAPPGAPLLVHIVDAAGKPVSDAPVNVERPGPLGEALWPAEWISDGAGTVWVPTLETGEHRIRLKGAAWQTVSVPALPADKPVELKLVK